MIVPLLAIVVLLMLLDASISSTLPPIQYTITRRGGSLPSPDTADLEYLVQQLQIIEARFNATHLETTSSSSSNQKPVRKPTRVHGTQGGTVLLGEVGREGNWFASLHIGEPVQTVDMDLDMLTTDWWIFSTQSDRGSYYLDFNIDSEKALAFPTCRYPADVIHLPAREGVVNISFAHCRPAKQWVRALLPSGAYLGLAPSVTLSQTKTAPLLTQFLDEDIINSPVWSLMLENGKEGLFRIGGTSANEVRESLDIRIETGIGGGHNMKRGQDHTRIILDTDEPTVGLHGGWGTSWKWSEVQSAEGWWDILMQGIWVDGVKALRNQHAILDINTPFILAPPHAAKSLYASISGSRQLPHPYDQFHAYPCLNPPKIHMEFAGLKMRILQGKKDRGTFSPGGRFSLGRMARGSGYCVGMIVESRMGLSTSPIRKGGRVEGPHSDMDRYNNLDDFWVIGEAFFHDVEVAFNWKDRRVGMRRILV